MTLPLAMKVATFENSSAAKIVAKAIHLDRVTADIDGAEKRNISLHPVNILSLY